MVSRLLRVSSKRCIMHNVKSTVLIDQSAVFASVTFTIWLLNVNIRSWVVNTVEGFLRSCGKDNMRRSPLRRPHKTVCIYVINVWWETLLGLEIYIMGTEILSNLYMSWNCMTWNAMRNCVKFEDLISWNGFVT